MEPILLSAIRGVLHANESGYTETEVISDCCDEVLPIIAKQQEYHSNAD